MNRGAILQPKSVKEKNLRYLLVPPKWVPGIQTVTDLFLLSQRHVSSAVRLDCLSSERDLDGNVFHCDSLAKFIAKCNARVQQKTWEWKLPDPYPTGGEDGRRECND